jgi:hypothetical protein
MPKTIEYYGVWACSRILTGIHNSAMERRLGQRDATMRFGVKDAPLWLCERVLDFAATGRLHPGPNGEPPVLYTFAEAARFAGITQAVAKRIFPKRTPAVLVPIGGGEPAPLFPEPWLHAIRRMIASGEIPVRPSSLTRPKMGVQILSPRHTLAADQNAEEAAFKRANPYAGIRW